VHTAPAHGLDDFKLCRRHHIDVRHNYGALRLDHLLP